MAGVFLLLSIMFFAFFLMTAEAAEFPDNLFFRSLEQGFSYEYLYALKDGKIWIKPNTGNTGVKGEWGLFNKTGVPSGKEAASFTDTDRIVQFSTEGTMIAAVSSRGRFYIWQPTFTGETVWRDETGAPFEDALYLPENRIWCFSFSTMRAPWKRETPMHENDIVSYWEDADGNKTEFGFTATIYSVTKDGQRIRYTDTGLPTSWNRAFTSPERGKFIIENMSASASTVFVINKTGKMYTRMLDFELEGGCPALRYVYNSEKRTKGDDVAPLMTSIRTLPLPGWREQEPVREVLNDQKMKHGKAALTKKITILLTGKGNAARELRVQGRDSKGNYGYWKKMVSGSRWEFVVTGEKFRESDIIKNYMSRAAEGKTLDMNYTGKLMKSGEADLHVELLGFYYYSTPAVLRIHLNNRFFDLKFHTVDLWSPTVQKKYFPELIGSPDGEPKLLQGTIEFPDNILDSPDPYIKNIADNYFRQFNRQPVAFTVTADDRRVFIRSKTLQRSLDKKMDYEFRDCIKIDLVNEDYHGKSDTEGFFTSIAVNPDLELISDISDMTKKDVPLLFKLIELNQNALDEIQNRNKNLKSASCTSGCVSLCILPVYYIFNGCVSITGLPHWDLSGSSPGIAENVTQLGGVSYTGGTPLKEYAAMNLNEAFKDSDDYKRAVKIVKDRLYKLDKLCKDLSDKSDK